MVIAFFVVFALVVGLFMALLPIYTSEEYREKFSSDPFIQFKVCFGLIWPRSQGFSVPYKVLILIAWVSYLGAFAFFCVQTFPSM